MLDLLPLGLSPRHYVIVTLVSTHLLVLHHVQTARRGNTPVRQRRRMRRLAWLVRPVPRRLSRVMPLRIACLLLATRDTRVRTEVRARLVLLVSTKSRPAVRRARRAEQEHTRIRQPRRLRRLAFPAARTRSRSPEAATPPCVCASLASTFTGTTPKCIVPNALPAPSKTRSAPRLVAIAEQEHTRLRQARRLRRLARRVRPGRIRWRGRARV